VAVGVGRGGIWLTISRPHRGAKPSATPKGRHRGRRGPTAATSGRRDGVIKAWTQLFAIRGGTMPGIYRGSVNVLARSKS